MIGFSPRFAMIKDVAKYTLLPGFGERVVGLMPRFGMIAYFMALVFEIVGLLPKGHPYLKAAQMGRYRIRDVLAVAANNLHGGLRNADQYIVFIIFLLGSILLAVQFALLFGLIVTSSAHAATGTFINMFQTTYPEIDLAHLMLDKVFGIPGFFNSCFDPTVNAANASGICSGFTAPSSFPTPFQLGMQQLFQFYSTGIMALGGFVLVYYAFVLLVETVGTGSPFGNRFQSIYAPMRLVLAVLLIMPLAHGYSTGQYIVLWAAKYGSAVATNSWNLFNNRAGSNPLGLEPQQMVGQPATQDIESIVNFFYVAQTCRAAYNLAYDKEIQPYFVRPAGPNQAAAAQAVSASTSFADAKTFYGQGDVNIVFGHKDDSYTKYDAQVKPYCGVMNIQAMSKSVTGIQDVYEAYFRTIMNLWYNADIAAYGTRMACVQKFADKDGCVSPPSVTIAWDAADTAVAGQNFYKDMRLDRQSLFTSDMSQQITNVRSGQNTALDMDSKTILFGWGGAGVWFNKLVAYNGALVDALMTIPAPVQMPMVMEYIAKKKQASEAKVDAKDRYSPSTASGENAVPLDKQMNDADLDDTAMDVALAKLFDATYQQVQNTEATAKPKTGNTDSPIRNLVSYLFGQSGLFSVRSNSEVFPLVKLAMLGREMINKTLILIAAGGLLTGMGGLVGASMGPVGEMLGGLGSFAAGFATMGIVLGVLLYYVIPMMPFIYFFFAVGRWVKTIFEAMVAIPLWAMAHMRIDGNGIPGSGAISGYFLILEIFLRPIVILFGLLCGVSVFSAMAVALDSVFNIVVMNVGGFDMTTLSAGGADTFANSARDGLDALFYTFMYTLLIYMMATSSFKLIDVFPNTIMRWAGSNASAFRDGQGDPLDDLNYYMIQKIRQTADDVKENTLGLGKSTGSIADMINTRTLLNGPTQNNK